MKAAYTLLSVLTILVFGAAAYGISQHDAGNSPEPMANLTLTSSAFTDGGTIPAKYTCDGEGAIPPLSFSGIPDDAQSLVLIMDDPDIPQEVKEGAGIDVFDHWIVFNIPPTTDGVTEGEAPAGTPGENSAGEHGYTGPCPPGEYEPTKHRYVFKLYALNGMLDVDAGATKTAVERAMDGRILDQATLTGMYERQ